MLCVWNVNLTIGLASERMLHKDYYRKSSVENKSVVLGLKELDAKTNWLAVNRQS
jgi:hypothetical protein